MWIVDIGIEGNFMRTLLAGILVVELDMVRGNGNGSMQVDANVVGHEHPCVVVIYGRCVVGWIGQGSSSAGVMIDVVLSLDGSL